MVPPVTDYLEKKKKEFLLSAILAFFRTGFMGGVRRQTHGRRARAGLVAGGNMTGKKRNSLRQIPILDRNFRFAAPLCRRFQRAATRVDLRGTYAKKKVSARYYQGESCARSCFAIRPIAKWNYQERIAARPGKIARGPCLKSNPLEFPAGCCRPEQVSSPRGLPKT